MPLYTLTTCSSNWSTMSWSSRDYQKSMRIIDKHHLRYVYGCEPDRTSETKDTSKDYIALFTIFTEYLCCNDTDSNSVFTRILFVNMSTRIDFLLIYTFSYEQFNYSIWLIVFNGDKLLLWYIKTNRWTLIASISVCDQIKNTYHDVLGECFVNLTTVLNSSLYYSAAW